MHPPEFDRTPPEGVSDDSFAIFLGFKNTMMLQRRLMMKLLSGEETHPAQAGCLRMLAIHDGLSQSELADKLHVSRPTVTTMLQKMESAGVIERRNDDNDQRLTRIYLTDSGRALEARLGAVFADAINAAVGDMEQTDRAELVRLLGQINSSLSRALENA